MFRHPKNKKDDAVYLEHMQIAIEEIEKIAAAERRGLEQQWSVERGLEIIGEAARNVSEECKRMICRH